MTPTKRPIRKAALLCSAIVLLLLAAACGGDPADTAAPSDTDTADTADTGDSDGPAGEPEFRLQFANFVGPDTAPMAANIWWAEELARRTDGRVEVTFFHAGSLLGASEIFPGVGDGRADLGYFATAYHPAELPLSQSVGIPFVTSDVEAQGRAFNELYETNDAFRAEYEDAGVRVLHFQPISENVLGTPEPIDGIEDLQGKQIRGIGYVSNALAAIGANPISIPADELYEALQRGVVEGFSGFAFDSVIDVGLHEVAPHLIDTGFGNYILAVTVVNQDTWDSLPDDIQAVINDMADESVTTHMRILQEVVDRACDTFLESGGTISSLSDEDKAEWREAIGDSILEQWFEDTGENAQEFWDQYIDALRRYEAETGDAQSSLERCREQQDA